MSKEYKDVIVGLDVGTSKVVCMVAEIRPDGRFSVIGRASTPVHGLKRGVVVNIESTVEAIARAVQEAEMMSSCKIHDVYTGITGSHIKSFNSNGIVAIKDNKEVSQQDVERVLEVARAVHIPAEQQILHILRQEFIIDGQGGVPEPVGMSGLKLEVKVHIATGAIAAAQNLVKCVRRCGLEVADLVLLPLASSYAVLTEDEKGLGTCMIDIGAGTTDIAIFTQGAIRHTAVLPIGGDQITNDIAMALRTPTSEAEEIKLSKGVAMHSLAEAEEMIEVPGVVDRPARQLSRQRLADVIEPRVTELFELVQSELRRSGYEELLSSGFVLTGGAAAMEGMDALGEYVFGEPVRVGGPLYAGALSELVCLPQFAAAVGLLIEAMEQRRRGMISREPRTPGHWLRRFRAWLDKTF